MNFDEARGKILELLRRNGKAKNSEMLDLLSGNEKLLSRVREDLLFSDLADDKKSVGLVYLGDDNNWSRTKEETPGQAAGVSDSTAGSAEVVFAYDVFLSFSSRDTDLAKRVFDALSEQRLKVFWSPVSLRDRTGVFWFEELGKALEQARHLIVLLSEQALKSSYVRLEYMTFYNLMLACKGRLLFPIYEEGFDVKELPIFLKQLQGYCLDKTHGFSSVIAILTGVIADAGIQTASVQLGRLEMVAGAWFEEKRSQDSKGVTWVSMKCRNCGQTLGCFSSEYLPASFCPHCRAREIGTTVDAYSATRRPARAKLPLYDLVIAGVEPFARSPFSNEPFEPGPSYLAYESSVQEIMVRLELGEPEATIVTELEAKRRETPPGDCSWNSMRFWRIQEAVCDARALLAQGFKPFPLVEAKEHPVGPQQGPDYHSEDAWYRVHRIDPYDDQWECKSCGKRGPNYHRGGERPPRFCPYCGSEKERK